MQIMNSNVKYLFINHSDARAIEQAKALTKYAQNNQIWPEFIRNHGIYFIHRIRAVDIERRGECDEHVTHLDITRLILRL